MRKQLRENWRREGGRRVWEQRVKGKKGNKIETEDQVHAFSERLVMHLGKTVKEMQDNIDFVETHRWSRTLKPLTREVDNNNHHQQCTVLLENLSIYVDTTKHKQPGGPLSRTTPQRRPRECDKEHKTLT